MCANFKFQITGVEYFTIAHCSTSDSLKVICGNLIITVNFVPTFDITATGPIGEVYTTVNTIYSNLSRLFVCLCCQNEAFNVLLRIIRFPAITTKGEKPSGAMLFTNTAEEQSLYFSISLFVIS